MEAKSVDFGGDGLLISKLDNFLKHRLDLDSAWVDLGDIVSETVVPPPKLEQRKSFFFDSFNSAESPGLPVTPAEPPESGKSIPFVNNHCSLV